MKKNYINPECRFIDFSDVTMLQVSSELNNDEENLITFGGGGNYTGELFQ